jgi:hypothetical protein
MGSPFVEIDMDILYGEFADIARKVGMKRISNKRIWLPDSFT